MTIPKKLCDGKEPADRRRTPADREAIGRRGRRSSFPATSGRRLALLLLVLTIGTASVHAQSIPSGRGNDVIAKVNGAVITRRDFQVVYRQAVDRHAREGNPVDEAHIAALRQSVIRQLVDEELLFQESFRQGIEVPPEAVDAAFAAARARFEEDPGFAQELAQRYMNEAQFRGMLHRQLAIERLLEGAVGPEVVVTEEEVRRYYETNPNRFQVPEAIHLRHILVRRTESGGGDRQAAARRKIELIKEQLDRGVDFAALAEQHSEEALGAQGGDLGYVQRGEMLPSLEAAAFGLRVGEVSPVVATDYGFHLLKLIDRRPAATTPLEKARPGIRETLLRIKRDRAVRDTIETLRETADIQTAY